MKKKEEEILDEVFSAEQRKLIKKAIVRTEDLSETLTLAVMRIGNETSLLLFGTDMNNNVHFTMMSEDSFKKLQKFKITGVSK